MPVNIAIAKLGNNMNFQRFLKTCTISNKLISISSCSIKLSPYEIIYSRII